MIEEANVGLKWFSKDIGGKLDATESYDYIKSSFFTAFVAAGKPEGMAVFELYDNTFDIVTLYFTPNAKELAEYFKAMPCEKPPLSIDLTIIVGVYGSFEYYYSSD
jgi:hypothetical protein